MKGKSGRGRRREEGEEGLGLHPSLCPQSLPSSSPYCLQLQAAPWKSPEAVLLSPSCSSYDSLYCSPACSAAAHFLHLHSEDSDVWAALRLRLLLPCPYTSSSDHHRIFGILTNRHKLSFSPDFSDKVRSGARAIAAAGGFGDGDLSLEEALLCLTITNSVEVQDETGRSLGIAVYGPAFSWINHSCSPNACYRFSISSPSTADFSGESKLRLAPSTVGNEYLQLQGENDVLINSLHTKELGPRVIVRSIKRIRKGEEVTVSYTDLLQPKAMRQSDLWSKYQFICSCSRCNASTPSYVDRVLQEISAYGPDFSRLNDDYSSLCNVKFADDIDETISEYLSVSDPKLCCRKLESILCLGLLQKLETNGGSYSVRCRLHPLHYLALNTYTTLASAYRMRSVDFLSVHSNTKSREHVPKAFDMSRISAAYSLLLAGATCHLLSSESSLIASAANFWISAGESLLTLACKFGGVMLAERGCSFWESLNPSKKKCPNRPLADMFNEELVLRQAEYTHSEYITRRFLDCALSMTSEIWSILVRGCRYLEAVEDPIDFCWLGKLDNHASSLDEVSSFTAEESICEQEGKGYTSETRVKIYELGVHCLLYGGYLATACYGQSSSLITHLLDVLHSYL